MSYRHSRRSLAGASLMALLPLLAAGQVGCGGHPVARKLQGRWLGETVENIDDDLIPQAAGWVRGMSFDFEGNAVKVTVPAAAPRSGKFKVVSAHRGQVRLNVVGADGEQYAMKLILDDEHSVRWMIGDGRAVVLRREL